MLNSIKLMNEGREYVARVRAGFYEVVEVVSGSIVASGMNHENFSPYAVAVFTFGKCAVKVNS